MTFIDYIAERKFIHLADIVFTFVQEDTFNGTPVLRHTSQLFDGCIIYLVYNFMPQFLEFLPFINVTFTLISGLSDFTAPYYSDHHRVDGMRILNNPMLKGWYALNITHHHPKLHHIPIGIPRSVPFLGSGFDVDKKDLPEFEEYIGWYNSKTFMDMEWVYRISSPTLSAIIDRMREKLNSDKLIYISFTESNSDKSNIAATRGFRRALADYIKHNTDFELHPLLPWKTYVDTLKHYKYTIEPFGRCMDGYRVWEALSLGVVPIVFRSPINELHEQLPFLIIDSFDQLTRDYLEAQYPVIVEKQYELERLDMEYWRKKIRSL